MSNLVKDGLTKLVVSLSTIGAFGTALQAQAPAVNVQNPQPLQIQNTQSRVYQSGDTIEDITTKIEIEGWNIFFDENSVWDYQRNNPGRGVSVELISRAQSPLFPANLHSPNYDGDHRKDGRARKMLQPLPSEDIPFGSRTDYAFVIVKETEGDKLIRVASYPVALPFHNFETADDRNRRVLSEVQLDSSLLEPIFKMQKSFEELGYSRMPHVYIRNTQDEFARAVYGTDTAIAVPSVVLTNPKIKDEGLMLIFYNLAAYVTEGGVFTRDYKADTRAETQFHESFKDFLRAIGFDGEKYFGNNRYDDLRDVERKDPDKAQEIVRKRTEDYENQLRGHSLFRTFGIVTYDQYPAGTVRVNENDLLFSSVPFFQSVLTVFRFYPVEFIQRYSSLKPEDKAVATSLGRSTLGYLESIVKNERRAEPEKSISGVLPSYPVLKQLFSQ